MNIAVVGTGYVGLVTAACFAESGNNVVGIDRDAHKIATLNRGEIPIFEPGLLELVQQNHANGRLIFTTKMADGLTDVHCIFIGVGTPEGADGLPDLTALWAVVNEIVDLTINKSYNHKIVLVLKSTVPIGTNAQVEKLLQERGCSHLVVANNPEFLKEGAAIPDFQVPDRVVVGVRNPEDAMLLRELYQPFVNEARPFLVMSPESAEMTKYAANAMLATKISFINEIANLCDSVGADIHQVRQGIGYDIRIGFQFLKPGPGYGGSCFPKDVIALIGIGERNHVPMQLCKAVDEVNDRQKERLFHKVKQVFDSQLAGKSFAIWGLAFKPKTDDIREAPARTLIDALLAAGSIVRVHDPEAMPNIREIYGDTLYYGKDPYDTTTGANALIIVTEWECYVKAETAKILQGLCEPIIIDGRNIFDPTEMAQKRVVYLGIGTGKNI
ncbi:MAG: UDP-glucose/GDP-mannose dehydrogenase family protein [Zavarzinella sp.]